MNEYIAPDGACYPCYALHGRAFCLGNAIEQGLKEVIVSERFQALRAKTVDTTPHCRACPWRYLCGGYCRALRQGASIRRPAGRLLCPAETGAGEIVRRAGSPGHPARTLGGSLQRLPNI